MKHGDFGARPSLVDARLLMFFIILSKQALASLEMTAPERFSTQKISWDITGVVAILRALRQILLPACSFVTEWELHAFWVSLCAISI
jgi:hypothetical protein